MLCTSRTEWDLTFHANFLTFEQTVHRDRSTHMWDVAVLGGRRTPARDGQDTYPISDKKEDSENLAEDSQICDSQALHRDSEVALLTARRWLHRRSMVSVSTEEASHGGDDTDRRSLKNSAGSFFSCGEPTLSRCCSVESNFSQESFVGAEYSVMMSEWVDDDCGELETKLMVLSGNSFKRVALKACDSDESSSLEERVSCIERNSGRFEFEHCANEDVPTNIARAESDLSRNSTGSATLVRDKKRTSSKFCEACAWPTFSLGNDEWGKIKSTLSTCDFNALDFSADDLSVVVAEIFCQMDLDQLNIPWSSVQSFILSVRARMLDNAYHNWTHVVDVTQTVFSIASMTGFLQTLSHTQRLALFLGALCHDLEHPGVSAGYLLRSNSNLAARYKKDPGLLEKHHSLRAFELMASDDIGLLQNLAPPARLEVRAMVRDLILATDMTHHAAFADAVCLASPAPGPGPDTQEGAPAAPAAPAVAPAAPAPAGRSCPAQPARGSSGAGRLGGGGGGGEGSGPGGAVRADAGTLLRMQALLKCADISNVCKPPRAAREWAVCVTDEFFAQGDLERAGGLAVTPMCDRAAQSRVGLQKGFVDHVAGPFYHRVAAGLFPAVGALIAQMRENRATWDADSDEALLAEVDAVRRARRPAGSPRRGAAAAAQPSPTPACPADDVE